jgi:putative ATP-dependent endonuclease of OLD family
MPNSGYPFAAKVGQFKPPNWASSEYRNQDKDEKDRQQVQVLLSTHSPHLAASAELDSMILIVGQKPYPLAQTETKLKKDDYAFLRRFLDATKANLFFARGVIIVEGDAENILLPAIARKIGRPLGKYGVSVVNVGHRGLFRYSRIFQRKDESKLPVPVALIPDRDIPPDSAKKLVGNDRKTESEWEAKKKEDYIANLGKDKGGSVATFPSDQWTLEFDLARKPEFASLMHQAIRLAVGEKGKTRDAIIETAKAMVKEWQSDKSKTPDQVAVQIYEPLYKRSVSKAIVAEQLARLIDELGDDPEPFMSRLPSYIRDAIEYVTPSSAKTAQGIAKGPVSEGAE